MVTVYHQLVRKIISGKLQVDARKLNGKQNMQIKNIGKREKGTEMKTKNEDGRKKDLKMIYISDYCTMSICHWIINMSIRFACAYFTAQLTQFQFFHNTYTPNGR